MNSAQMPRALPWLEPRLPAQLSHLEPHPSSPWSCRDRIGGKLGILETMWLALCLIELCTHQALPCKNRLTRVRKRLTEEPNAFSTESSTQPSELKPWQKTNRFHTLSCHSCFFFTYNLKMLATSKFAHIPQCLCTP